MAAAASGGSSGGGDGDGGGRKPPPKHVDMFADIGENSVGAAAVSFVRGRDNPAIAGLGFGKKKTDALAMESAIHGVTPAVDDGGNITWNALAGRGEETGSRTFRQAEDGGGFKEITQRRYRSGSIIEDHAHVKGDKRAPGAIMHRNRDGHVQYLEAQDRRRMNGLPNKVSGKE